MLKRYRSIGSTILRRACCALLLVASTACSSDALSPSVVTGSYELKTYNDEALPVVLRRIVDNPTTPGGASSECEDRLYAMTLVLDEQGRFMRTSERRLVCADSSSHEATHPTEAGRYAMSGASVTLTFDPTGESTTIATGTRTADSLYITRQTTTSASGTVTDPSKLAFTPAP